MSSMFVHEFLWYQQIIASLEREISEEKNSQKKSNPEQVEEAAADRRAVRWVNKCS